ncbi:MAG TPA: right-handed parallel beta-helix repeat-containing protein [Pyrinomonadaceae bacterium]
MTKLYPILKVIVLVCFTLGVSAAVQAQATRTWVSGVGDDVNPCSRTAPCKTFAGAISKTATGGEISVLDPGGYGALTITKAITVDGGTGSGWGSVLAAGISGFTVNITTNLSTDKVILRNLSINGNNTVGAFHGIRFLDGQQLVVDNVNIFNFSGSGIEIAQGQACNVFIRNTSIVNTGVGIKINSTSGTVATTIEDVSISAAATHGLQTINNAVVTVRRLTSTRNAAGSAIRAEGNTIINVEDSTVAYNLVGIHAAAASATIRIANCGLYHNEFGISAVGTVSSAGNNRNAGNVTPGAPNGAAIVVH